MKKSLGRLIGEIVFSVTLLTILVLMASFYISMTKLLTQRNLFSQQSAVESLVNSNKNFKVSTQKELIKLSKGATFNGKSFNNSDIKRILTDSQNANAQIKYSGFGTSKGDYLTLSKMPKGYDPRSRPWYKKAIASFGKVVWTAPYRDAETGQTVTTAAIALKNASGQVGVLELDLTYDGISQAIDAMKIGRTGSVTLVHKNGIVIVSNGESKKYTFKQGNSIKGQTIFKKIAKADAIKGTLQIDKIGKVYYNKGNKNSDNWSFAVVDGDDLNSELNSLLIITIIVVILMLIIATLYAIYSSKVIKAAIEVYVKHFEAASKGEFAKIKSFGDKKNWKLYFQPAKLGRKMSEPDKDGQEFNQISYQYNKMLDSVGKSFVQIQGESKVVADKSDSLLELSQQTDRATEEVAQAITGIAQVTTSQAQETSGSVEQVRNLSDVITTLHDNVKKMNERSSNSSKLNQKNLDISNEVITSWQQEVANMQELEDSVGNLNQQVKNINKIISVINGISQQTNLLALNASIEAASAGEAGKGFAVVATEIRKLSDQSKKATKEIDDILGGIQLDSEEMVKRMDDSVAGGERQTELLNQAISSSKDVFSVNQELIQDIQEIEQASGKITQVQLKIEESLENISAATEENSAGAEEVSANSEEVQATIEEFTNHIAELGKTADTLKNVVASFKFEKEE
ncbi:methyl-accepting chemotaxis protein [Liquorilactobacillus mali]|uniref:methyl-accepting chemotaxis protein n=1 Tax=Liquorilactobacillus mali TaxID=1618 RepID=UPI00264B38B6|nr:methyl-accepting chemotaxis protein [Liquorilactobacillus mali]MDN7145983.1 methyl-accepting chemotaxis protein [Liquorilactobacillus mali]